jgi:hypothetical protein
MALGKLGSPAGKGSAWRSEKLKRGATLGEGNTGPRARIFVRIKASKSRGIVCGSRFAGERVMQQRHGGRFLPTREERCAEGEAPEQSKPCTWLWDATSPEAEGRKTVGRLRKPEGGS